MATERPLNLFSERYAQWRMQSQCVRETSNPVSEHLVQCIWYDQLFPANSLNTVEGHRIQVLSPGWWNRQEGPDFKGAQIQFNERLYSGDVEIHLSANAWNQHGHHLDERYDNVILHVVLHEQGATVPIHTSQKRKVPTLVLETRLHEPLDSLALRIELSDYDDVSLSSFGRCSQLIPQQGTKPVIEFLEVAGEWRMLNKMRLLRERMDWVGADQAIYESIMYACGFSRFKQHFRAIARHLPYDRVRQLAHHDPMLLECAFLQIAGLLPDNLPEGTTAVPHFARLRSLRRDHLDGLRSLPLEWKRVGIRPNNNPERRLAGAARLFSRTAQKGLAATLEELWLAGLKHRDRRIAFEELFPNSLGFWATHCTWTGKKMLRPNAPLGAGRVRTIIGNVLVPVGLALSRQRRDRTMEEAVLTFFKALPQEPGNHIVEQMLPRIFAEHKKPRLNFCLQQGLLQMHQDWCEPNPACQNCVAYALLEQKGKGNGYNA